MDVSDLVATGIRGTFGASSRCAKDDVVKGAAVGVGADVGRVAEVARGA